MADWKQRVWPAEPPSGEVPPGPEEARRGDDREVGAWRLYGCIGVLGLALIVAAVVALVTFRGIRSALRRADPPPSPVLEARERVLPPEPRLQSDPAADMVALRARSRGILSTYGVVDMASGTARIPIDRAIDLTARGMKPASGPPLVPGEGPGPLPPPPTPPGREPSGAEVPGGGAP